MKRTLCLILNVIVLPVCLGQTKIDSLKKFFHEAETKGDSKNSLYALSSIAWEFSEKKQYDSSLYYYHEVLRKNSNAGLPMLASAFNGIGVAYGGTGVFDSSVHYYSKALALYRQLSDTTNIVIMETNFSILYKNKGLYEKSLESAFNALSILENQNPGRALASCYNTIGSVYALTNDNWNALKYYRKALDVRKEIGYVKGVAQSYNNIGEVYISLRQYDSALDNLFKALEIKRSIADNNSLSHSLQNIGDVFLNLGKKSEAEEYLMEALKLRRMLNDRAGQVNTLNSLGKLKLNDNDLTAAERFLNEAEELVREIKALDPWRQNLELKVKLHKARRDYSTALAYAEVLFIIRDSLLNIEKAENLQAMQIRYEMEKKEQEIQMLNNEKKLQQTEIEAKQNWIRGLALSTVLGLVIIILTYYSFRITYKGKRKVETLLRELHHRVKNNLQILSSVLSLQSQNLRDENAIQAVKSNEGRINAMALIHRKLYNEDQNRSINIREYIEELIQYLVYTYGYHERDLRLNLSIEEIDVDVDKAIPLGLILNELISNAFKYAYANQNNPELKVNLSNCTDSQIQILISDNGVGMATSGSVNDEKTFGVKMVKTLIKDLKGKYAVRSDAGTTYILNIPLT